MFVSSMKILTLNKNNASPTAVEVGDSSTQSVNTALSCGDSNGGRVLSGISVSNNKSIKRDQKHNSKTKFVHGNNSKVPQHKTQQHQLPQQFQHKSNSKGNKLKHQNYNNISNNNTSSSSLNRKKYFQHQHHQHYPPQQHYQQQQQYLTAMQKSTNTSQTTHTITNENNNTNLVKNQNYSDIDLLSQEHHQQHNNVVKSLVNLSTNLTESCTCLLQQNNCDTPSPRTCSGCSPSESSSLTTSTDSCHSQQGKRNLCYDNHLKSSLSSNSKTSSSNEVNIIAPKAPACNTCWTNFTKLPPQLKSAASNFKSNNLQEFVKNPLSLLNENLPKTVSSSNTSTTTTASSTYITSQLSSSPNSTTSKNKLFWKSSNSSESGVIAVRGEGSLSSSDYASGGTTDTPKLATEKQHYVSDKNWNTNASKSLGQNSNHTNNEQNRSPKIAANIGTTRQKQVSKYHQVLPSERTTMTTPLAKSDSSGSIKTSVSNNNSNKQQQKDTIEPLNVTNQVLNTISSNEVYINKPSPTPNYSEALSQNSYSLDFLHSVGVKMTGVGLRSPGIQESTTGHDNQQANNSSVRGPCLYTTTSTNQTSQRQSRCMNGPTSNNSGGNTGNQLQHYHHHQPSQLTIASFLHKDLLGGGNTSSSNAISNGSRRGALSSSNSKNTNNYNDQNQQQQQQQPHYTQQQQQIHSRYHHSYKTTPYHQQTVMHHTHYGGGVGHGGEFTRLNNGNTQRSSGYPYAHYHNAPVEFGLRKNNTLTQLHSRQLKNNIENLKKSVSNSQANKKSNYTSRSTGSLSSTKSISSSSSNISSGQLQNEVTQNSNSCSSKLNLAIETLPSKTLSSANQRGNHRGHHHNHHGHHHHTHLMMNSPNVLQHQNYYNLTYVTTDASASGPTTRVNSTAPQSLPPTPLQATNCNSPKSLDPNSGHVSVVVNFNASQLQYQRLGLQQQQQFHQFQQQQINFLNKKGFAPLSLNLSSPSPSPIQTSNTTNISLSSQQASSNNIRRCSQLDEATTAAAAAATSIPSSSSVFIGGNDFDSDCSSNNSSTHVKYQSTMSTISSSSSSSSLASSASITGQQVQQHIYAQPATPASSKPSTPSHSPLECNYNGATSQVFSNLQVTQLPQFYDNNSSNAVISLLKMPTRTQNTFPDEDYLLQHQFCLNATSNQKSPAHLNVASIITDVSNRSSNRRGYWSPLFQNNQLSYNQSSSIQTAFVPPNYSSSSSCGSSSASISPRLPNENLQQQSQHILQKTPGIIYAGLSPHACTTSLNGQLSNIVISNSSNSDSEIVFADSSSSSNSSSVSGDSNNGGNKSGISSNYVNGGHCFQRSSSQLLVQQQSFISQQSCQSPSSTSSLSSSSASTLTSAVRVRGGEGGESGIYSNSGFNSQFPTLPQISVTSLVGNNFSGSQHLPPTTASFYSHPLSLPPQPTPNNLLSNNLQTHHIRTSCSSTVHDFYTHTPPDRLLARAHLVEAKEAPVTLLNNSKWDRLSQDIWKKFISSQQTENIFKQKMLLWRQLYIFIKSTFPRFGLYLVGSTISGFGSDSSDVDMCLVNRNASVMDPRLEALCNLNLLRNCLSKTDQFENFNLIEAKVPILRFSDRLNQLEVDLNFNNCVGIKNTHLLYCYSQLDWRLRPLVLVTKLWAQYHNINNAKNMTISSYSLVLMVIHFLQCAVNPPVLPCLHNIFPHKFPLLRSNDFGYVDMNEILEPYDSKNTQTIGELFSLFLEYYSFFDYTQFAISVRTGGLLPINVCRIAKSIKNDIHQWKELCIEEPFDLTNTARSVYDSETFQRVKSVFVASWHILQETLDLNSVFSTISLQSSYTNKTPYSQIEPVIAVNHGNTGIKNYINDFSVSTVAGEEYASRNQSSIINDDESIVYVDGDNTDEGVHVSSSMVSNITGRKFRKRKDLNRTLTPQQTKAFDNEEFSLPLPSSSSTIKTGTLFNGNNINNRTTSATIS